MEEYQRHNINIWKYPNLSMTRMSLRVEAVWAEALSVKGGNFFREKHVKSTYFSMGPKWS